MSNARVWQQLVHCTGAHAQDDPGVLLTGLKVLRLDREQHGAQLRVVAHQVVVLLKHTTRQTQSTNRSAHREK